MKKSVIFLPVGRNIEYHPSYDKENHWRMVKDSRNYDVILCPYKEFEPEVNTYDVLLEPQRGLKWKICKWFLENYDYSQYEYIGFFDDDIVTDIQSINTALQIAEENNLKIFQLSLLPGSNSNHPITNQNKNLLYSTTNFVECMSPFYHISIIEDFKQLLNCHATWPNWSGIGWGLDCIVSDSLKTPSAIIHEVTMYHKPSVSTYNRAAAHNEMLYIWKYIYPKFMKEKYNEDAVFVDNIRELTHVYKI